MIESVEVVFLLFFRHSILMKIASKRVGRIMTVFRPVIVVSFDHDFECVFFDSLPKKSPLLIYSA